MKIIELLIKHFDSYERCQVSGCIRVIGEKIIMN
jgi:hypothetical protein